MPVPFDFIQGIVALGATGILALGFYLFLTGKLHSDGEVTRIVTYYDKRYTDREAERDKREATLVAERDNWRARSVEWEERGERLADAFQEAYNILVRGSRGGGK